MDLRNDSYEERLKNLLWQHETMRLSDDLIEILKTMKCFEDIDSGNFYIVLGFNFRCHSFKLITPKCNLNIRINATCATDWWTF